MNTVYPDSSYRLIFWFNSHLAWWIISIANGKEWRILYKDNFQVGMGHRSYTKDVANNIHNFVNQDENN